MAGKIPHLGNSKDEFAKRFADLCGTKSDWMAWSDFVLLSALSISNAMDREGETHEDREREYLETIRKYTKTEQQVFPELFAMLVEALEANPEQDFLGEIFMALKLNSHWKKQFFTPYSVCRMIAAMTIGDKKSEIKERGWVSICDCCCGAGALLIGARNELLRKHFSPTNTLFVAQDIDRTAALMCYLQLSLLGCAGYVIVGNSLTNPMAGPTGSPLLITPSEGQEVWLMPALYDKAWAYRIQLEKLKLLMG